MKIVDTLLNWLEARTGLKEPIMHMATHLVPKDAKWMYVFGSAVLTCFVVQIVTGIALATLYVPAAGEAHQSIWYITNKAPFGSVTRGMHFFGASAMILFCALHMLRVYLTGSFKFPRELNWLTGVVLLLCTLAMGLTGQVLRWDQTSVWTVAVGSEQAWRMPFLSKLLVKIFLCGGTIGGSTLSHFFAMHVFVFPAAIIGVLGLHLWLVLHHGISEPPKVGQPVKPETYKQEYEELLKTSGRPFWPDAAWRDLVFSTVLVLSILALAIWVGPPHIEKPPDPSIIQAEPRPDWYLVWYFGLLALLPHKAEDAVIILFPLALVLTLLAVPFVSNRGERSILRRPWAAGSVIVIIAAMGALTIEGFKQPWTPAFDATPLPQEVVGATSGPVYDGARVFDQRGCLYCHTISGHGGKRGPDLTDVGNRLTHDQIVIRIVNGGYNMPAYAGNITPKELSDVAAFLETRKK